jgi:hypothetical protein
LQKAIIAAAAIALAVPFSVLTSGAAQAGPLCDHHQQFPEIYQRCLTAEQNQAYCGLASGCVEGDPCTVGSPTEQAICKDMQLSGQAPSWMQP